MARKRTPLLVKIPRYVRYFRDALRGYATPFGVRIPFDKTILTYTMRKVISRSDYETDELRFTLDYVDDTTRILELGGGIGYVSAVILTQRSGAHVTSFEANPQTAEFHERVMKLNGLTNRRLYNAVLGDTSKGDTCSFHVSREFWASSTYRRHGTQEIEVPVVDARTFLRSNSFDLLLIDIEGGEAELVELLDQPYFRTIVMELHTDVIGPKATEDLLRKLEMLGYRLRDGSWHALPSVCVFELNEGSANRATT